RTQLPASLQTRGSARLWWQARGRSCRPRYKCREVQPNVPRNSDRSRNMAERPHFAVEPDMVEAAAAGFEAAGSHLVRVLIETNPDARDFLRMVRAEVRRMALSSPPPDSAAGALRDRWHEVAIGAIDHIFAHGGIDREN